jgi:hypothetical protein
MIMSTNKTLTILAASGVLAFLAVSPVYAEESIVDQEKQQLDNSAAPDVDPGASKGPDKSIVDQEKMQLGNQPGPDVPMGAGADTKGDPSIVEQEQKDIED